MQIKDNKKRKKKDYKKDDKNKVTKERWKQVRRKNDKKMT